jgi:hypothetical protein
MSELAPPARLTGAFRPGYGALRSRDRPQGRVMFLGAAFIPRFSTGCQSGEAPKAPRILSAGKRRSLLAEADGNRTRQAALSGLPFLKTEEMVRQPGECLGRLEETGRNRRIVKTDASSAGCWAVGRKKMARSRSAPGCM